MSIFSNDTLVAGSGTKASTTPQADGCRTPAKGLPPYDPLVLQTLYGQGKITRSEYDRVKAGVLSIEALNLATSDLSRLRCQDAVFPTDLDDLMERARLKIARFTGLGPKVVELDFVPSVLQPAMTGLSLDAVGLPKDFEVTATYDAATRKLSVSADAKVRWSVLALYQKGPA